MLLDLASNPNVHQRIAGGRRLYRDPEGRFAIYLQRDLGIHSATVQRVRLDGDEVESAVAEIRALLRAEAREGTEWELGAGTRPADLVERLAVLGIVPDVEEPIAYGMVLRGIPEVMLPPGVHARPVASVDELRVARALQAEGFGFPRAAPSEDELRADFEGEGVDGSTFLALVDDEPVGGGYAAYTPHGLILFGGAVVERARGRGAYRALIVARAEEAARRGTPALVVHAGRMSCPILERVGFERICRIDRLVDVL